MIVDRREFDAEFVRDQWFCLAQGKLNSDFYLCRRGACQWRRQNVPKGGVKVYQSG
jgi:hypothetical protein